MSTTTALADEIAQLNRRWMQAYVDRDVGFLEQHLADDYVSTFPDGAVLDKKSEIEALRSGAVTISAMQPREMNVRIFGEAAVITGRSTISAHVAGREERGDFRFTDVWARRGSLWQAVASQVTHIAPR